MEYIGKEKAVTAGTFTKAPRIVRKSKVEEVSFILLPTCDRRSTTETTELDGQQGCDERSQTIFGQYS